MMLPQMLESLLNESEEGVDTEWLDKVCVHCILCCAVLPCLVLCCALLIAPVLCCAVPCSPYCPCAVLLVMCYAFCNAMSCCVGCSQSLLITVVDNNYNK